MGLRASTRHLILVPGACLLILLAAGLVPGHSSAQSTGVTVAKTSVPLTPDGKIVNRSIDALSPEPLNSSEFHPQLNSFRNFIEQFNQIISKAQFEFVADGETTQQESAKSYSVESKTRYNDRKKTLETTIHYSNQPLKPQGTRLVKFPRTRVVTPPNTSSLSPRNLLDSPSVLHTMAPSFFTASARHLTSLSQSRNRTSQVTKVIQYRQDRSSL
jgi:hypothetical protein